MSNGTSLSEFVIFWYANKYFPDVKYRDKPFGSEFDVYIPSINTAIEFDGKYWHADKLDSDNEKDKLCKSHDVRLIRVRDYSLPDTVSAEIIRHDELSWYDEDDVIKRLLCMLGLKIFDVDIARDSEAIQDAYSVVSKNAYAEWSRMAYDVMPDVMNAVSSCDMRLLKSDLWSEIGIDMRTSISVTVYGLLRRWMDTRNFLYFDSWFYNVLEKWYSDVYNLPIESLLNCPYSTCYIHIDEPNVFCFFGVHRGSNGRYLVSFFFYSFIPDESSPIGYRLRVSPVTLFVDDTQKTIGDVFLDNPDAFADELVDTSYDLTALVLSAIAYVSQSSVDRCNFEVTRKGCVHKRIGKRGLQRGSTSVSVVRDVVVRKYFNGSSELYKNQGTTSTGRHVRKHVRRGHIQRYWVGSGVNRHVEYRFIQEIIVNADREEDSILPSVSVV